MWNPLDICMWREEGKEGWRELEGAGTGSRRGGHGKVNSWKISQITSSDLVTLTSLCDLQFSNQKYLFSNDFIMLKYIFKNINHYSEVICYFQKLFFNSNSESPVPRQPRTVSGGSYLKWKQIDTFPISIFFLFLLARILTLLKSGKHLYHLIIKTK